MTHYRLTVKAFDGTATWEVDEWAVLVVIASASAEPETLGELFDAARRYQPEHSLDTTGGRATNLPSEDHAGPWCVVDLTSRTVVATEGLELPNLLDAWQPDDGVEVEGVPVVFFALPDNWELRHVDDQWRDVLRMRAAGSVRRTLDARVVIYGEPLLRYLAERAVAETHQHPLDDETAEGNLIRSIHADWLMTPRNDLEGHTPRHVLLRDHKLIGMDLQHRQHQWSLFGSAPPPLSVESAAYRYGGFGTTEIVCCFELIRSLTWDAWLLATGQHDFDPQPETVTDIDDLVSRLSDRRDLWLSSPYPDGSSPSMTTGELIESERRRMPVTADGSHLDCDCPICDTMAEAEFGPMFCGFDGHHLELEDEFAFSMYETREEWEHEQEEYRRFSEEMDRKRAEREATGEDADEFGSVWKSSFIDWDAIAAGNSPISPAMAIGFPLGELIGELQEQADDRGRDSIDALNASFSEYRQAQDDVIRDSALESLAGTLEDVAQQFPDLASRSADLQSRLHALRRQATVEPHGDD